MRRRLVGRRRFFDSFEVLERRDVPAAFGIPWGDPQHLTLSFAPDGTAIAGHRSSLFGVLESHASDAAWQRDVLRAFQSWAVNTNVNISPRPDNGAAFGIAGATQHDPRFGDIRIGAQAMSPEVLAITVPGGPAMTGTWAGDMFLNANVDFGGSGSPSLFPVALHEAGHVFGLPNSTDPKSPMYPHFQTTARPTAADLAALQSLFGARQPDSFEGSSGNQTPDRASQFPSPPGAAPAIVFADLTTSTDVDYFKLQIPSDYSGKLTVRLQSKGLSLLAPKLTLTTQSGAVVGHAAAQSGFGDTVNVTLSRSTPGATYFVRIEGATNDVFRIGSYALMASLDGRTTTSPVLVDRLLSGAYGTLSPDGVKAILEGNTSGGFEHTDAGTNEDANEATVLAPVAGYAPSSHYDATGSISTAGDVDFYRIRAPQSPKDTPIVATIDVRALTFNGVVPAVTLLDRDLVPVPTQVLVNDNGSLRLQATGLKSGANYFVRVSGQASAGLGNYELSVDFGRQAATLQTFANGQLGATAPAATYNFYVAQSQLFSFLLQADALASTPAGAAVSATIRDAAGRVVFSVKAVAGKIVSGPTVFLAPGAYTLTIAAVAPPGAASSPSIAYRLLGDVISDPIGPALADPTLKPVYTTTTSPPIYSYPGGVQSTTPYLLTLAK